ncbi:DNA polymerase III subunit epsilon [Buchnera aphidicola]|uniref:DNA polymerase III subunit epsilon n=1 Tax=Buchnera aphidicola TaxID=9 RepID=UPI0031B6CC57
MLERIVFLDTETTGMNKTGILYQNHKIIEIGAIEMINRKFTGKNLHFYLQPNRLVDNEAYKIHGISNKFLMNKPVFFEVSKKILKFLKNSMLVVHNAIFDISFLDYEFSCVSTNIPKIHTFCNIFDTLVFSRKLFPGKKNTLDALCQRYQINNKNRLLHGALLDAKLLAQVYLSMTSKQETFCFKEKKYLKIQKKLKDISNDICVSSIIYATKIEEKNHFNYLKDILKNSKKNFW